jgi:alanine racemase
MGLIPPDANLMAVVKADGYGHGAVEVARAAVEAGATWLGVATLEEGMSLRQAGLEVPILLLSEPPPGSEAIAIAARLTPTVYSVPSLERLARAAPGASTAVHLKVDTGMHRNGVWPPEEVVSLSRRAMAEGLYVEGVWTHLSSSEDDAETTSAQLARFDVAVELLKRAEIVPDLVHAANSGALLRHPEATYDLVRPGIAIYGIAPAPGMDAGPRLVPALSWVSTVAFARRLQAGERLSYGQRYELQSDSWIATVPVGYADGYPRAASSNADVLIRGMRCRVAGSVTMDQLIVDCGRMEPRAGDEVVLLGGQGDDVISAWELAERCGTIAWEVVSRIGARVPREHVSKELPS